MEFRVTGSVTEPAFNHNKHGVTQEMLQDWLTLLMNKNAEDVTAAQPDMGASIKKESVQFLFQTCDKLKMSPEVKYLSLELFDRFMLQHVNDLHQHVLKSGNLKTRDKDWLDIKKRVSNQVVLRIITCIQIASKLTSHYRVLSPHRARRFLQDAGHRYNTESIMQSELRVIKTLNFRLAKHSPLVYLEAILESLGHMDPSANILKLHDLGMKLLDLVYLQYDDVYYKLYQVATGGSPSTSQQIDSFASVRADKMLLMVSIVTASAYIIENESHQKTMIMLSKLTKIPQEDIADFASVIFSLVVDTRED